MQIGKIAFGQGCSVCYGNGYSLDGKPCPCGCRPALPVGGDTLKNHNLHQENIRLTGELLALQQRLSAAEKERDEAIAQRDEARRLQNQHFLQAMDNGGKANQFRQERDEANIFAGVLLRALQKIAEFDKYEPAGPAAAFAKIAIAHPRPAVFAYMEAARLAEEAKQEGKNDQNS